MICNIAGDYTNGTTQLQASNLPISQNFPKAKAIDRRFHLTQLRKEVRKGDWISVPRLVSIKKITQKK